MQHGEDEARGVVQREGHERKSLRAKFAKALNFLFNSSRSFAHGCYSQPFLEHGKLLLFELELLPELGNVVSALR